MDDGMIGNDEIKFCYDIENVRNELIYRMLDMNVDAIRICKKINHTNSDFCANRNSITNLIEPYSIIPINIVNNIDNTNTNNDMNINTNSTITTIINDTKKVIPKSKYGIIMF